MSLITTSTPFLERLNRMEKPIKSFPVPSEEEPLVIMVTGSRKHTNRPFIREVLNSFLPRVYRNEVSLILGGASGADEIVRDWAQRLLVPYKIFEANWPRYGRPAGQIRNSVMLDQKPSIVLAFPLGEPHENLSRGTYNAIEEAIRRGIPTCIFTGDPETHKITGYKSEFPDV